MLAHGPNGNPPERPAMTQRNCPPDDDAVNPSCEVVPSAPSTTPPPLTRGSDAYAASCDPSSAQRANVTTITARAVKCFMKTPPLCIAPAGYSTWRERPSVGENLTRGVARRASETSAL